MSEPIVVTGLGWATPLGCELEPTWAAMLAGRIAVDRPRRLGIAEFQPPTRAVAEMPESELALLRERHGPIADVRTLLGVAAGERALEHAGIGPGPHARAGVVMGSGPGWHDFARFGAHLEPGGALDVASWAGSLVAGDTAGAGLATRAEEPAAEIAARFGMRGPVHAVTTACAAGNQAIGLAYRALQRGEANFMVAGGTDAMVNVQGLVFFVLLGAAAQVDEDRPSSACRPFDRKRTGLVMGEGAGCVVLERASHAAARGARVWATLRGYGASLDAWRTTAPPPDGYGAADAMRAALAEARMAPEAIDYVNAHGTGTKRNDPAEVAAIRSVFGAHADRLLVASGKGALGHLLSGAAGVAFVATVLSIRDGVVPPTANLENPDRACDLDHVAGGARRRQVDAALVDAFAFGGQNACLLVTGPELAEGRSS